MKHSKSNVKKKKTTLIYFKYVEGRTPLKILNTSEDGQVC